MSNVNRERNMLVIWNRNKFFACIFAAMIVCFMFGAVTERVYVQVSGHFISMAQHNKEVAKLEAQIANGNATISKKDKTIKERDALIVTLKHTVDTTDKTVDRIMNKYWFVYRDRPANSTMCYSHLLKLDETAKKVDINPYLVLSMFKLESQWNSQAKNAVSTARGYGQILEGTGRAVWTKILNKSGYSHDMALDPYINIEMGTSYLAYKVHAEGLNNALIGYSGNCIGDKYITIVQNNMKNMGKDFNVTKYID